MRLSCTVCDYEAELKTSPVFVFEDRWNPLNPKIEDVWCHQCNGVSRAARSLASDEVSELLNQKATTIENFKRRSKRLFRGYTGKDQKRISELEEELHALKRMAESLPKVLLRCLTCGGQVCDRLFLWAKPPSFRDSPVVVDWVHECGGDLVCHPPAFHYNRSGANPDPVVTLDLRCRVVSAVNCNPENYKVGSHPSGTEEFILDSRGLEQARQTLERGKDGSNNPRRD